MEKKKILKLLPLVVLLLATAYLLLTIATTDISLTRTHIVGLIFLGVTIATQFFNTKYGYWMTALLLMFAIFSLASFTPTIYYLRIAVIKIDPFGIFTALLFIIVHRNEIPDWIQDLMSDEGSSSNPK